MLNEASQNYAGALDCIVQIPNSYETEGITQQNKILLNQVYVSQSPTAIEMHFIFL